MSLPEKKDPELHHAESDDSPPPERPPAPPFVVPDPREDLRPLAPPPGERHARGRR